MQQAILFDYWQTLIEDTRERMALEKRMEFLGNFIQNDLNSEKPSDSKIEDAFQSCQKWFFSVYHKETRTLSVTERLEHILTSLGYDISKIDLSTIDDEFGAMGIYLNPVPTPHIVEVLPILAKKYKLGIVSDTGYTPGSILRKHLDHLGILKYFSAFSFSNETGHAKPHPRTFLTALEQLNLPVENAMHCGDLPDHDIAGANNLGITSVLYTGTHPSNIDGFIPDYQISDWRELPDLAEKVFVEVKSP